MPTTQNGTVYTTTNFTTPGGDRALWGIADKHRESRDVPIVVYTHGFSGAYNQFAATAAFSGIRNWMIDNGWGWVESAGGGDSWGNDAARRSYSEAFAHVSEILDVGDVVVLGRSMGGIISYWLYMYEPAISRKAVGLMVNSGTTDLIKRMGAPPGGEATIRTAFDLTWAGADWVDKLTPYDPMSFPADDWDGKNVLQLYGSADSTVDPLVHGQAWLDKYAARCNLALRDIREGGDHSPENGSYLQTAAMAAFLERVHLTSPDPEPSPAPDPTAVYRITAAYLVGSGGSLQSVDLMPSF